MDSERSQIDFGGIGTEEDFLEQSVNENKIALERQEKIEAKARAVRLTKAQSAYSKIRCFKVHLRQTGDVTFCVHVKSGQVCVAQTALFEREWTRLQARYALRWLDMDSLRHSDLEMAERLDLPTWLNLPSDENSKQISRLKRKARIRWFGAWMTSKVNAFFETISNLVAAFFGLIFAIICLCVLLYGAYYLFGGIAGLLNFGLKNL